MNLISAFFDRCDAAPDQAAFVQDGRRIGYDQFRRRAIQIGSVLYSRVESSGRVAVALERGIDAAAAIYGIAAFGGCYVPLDVKNPAERLRFIVADADPGIVIGRGQCPAWVNDRDKWLDIDAVAGNPPVPPAPAELRPGALGAILYTSGSTGSPKGVALSHGAMLNFADWAARTFGISSGDRIASLAPLHFDLSVFDLFSSLNAGATVYFVPPQLTLSPVRLTAWLSEHDITAWYTVPSLLSFIAFKGALDATPLPALKTLLFAGEVFPTQHLIRLCELLPATELFNLYGPTETNVCCYWPVDRSRLNPAEPIPIGVPACESRLKIDAETGELWVKSKNNFTGYWQKGRLERAPSADGWHPTGDRVSRNDQGEFLYHGRLDRMLKCSGYRVEPAEIEAALRKLPGVENCAVVGLPDPVGGQRPAAAVVLKSGFELAESLKPLRQLLPGYMQPGRILAMDTLPLLSNGKTDYQALEKAFKNL